MVKLDTDSVKDTPIRKCKKWNAYNQHHCFRYINSKWTMKKGWSIYLGETTENRLVPSV